MRPLQMNELSQLAQGLEELISCRLQKVDSGANWLSFMFYGRGREHFLFLNLDTRCPVLLPIQAPKNFKRQVIPALLFIKAHFADHFLSQIVLDEKEGRILRFIFSNQATLEFRLFPHGQNLIATTSDGKKISANKVAEISAPPMTAVENQHIRTPQEFTKEWLEQFGPKNKTTADANPSDLEKIKAKALAKKMRALELVEKEIEAKKAEPFKEIGEWLKMNQTLKIKPEWQIYIDTSKSFAENLNAVFNKAKQNSEKLAAAKIRAELLQSEIVAIQNGTFKMPSQGALSTIKKAGARGRTIELASGHVLYLGRNAEENLKILRVAQAWDYWIHIKDRPGSHGIVRRNKNEKIADKVILEALQHLLSHQFGAKAKNYVGDRYECLVTECRYVKPIKGDKLGRVNYQSERVITVQFKG